MSTTDSTDPLSPGQKPVLYTAHSGAELAGVVGQTVRVHVEPDVLMVSATGKRYPLYTEATLKAWAASWHAGGAA